MNHQIKSKLRYKACGAILLARARSDWWKPRKVDSLPPRNGGHQLVKACLESIGICRGHRWSHDVTCDPLTSTMACQIVIQATSIKISSINLRFVLLTITGRKTRPGKQVLLSVPNVWTKAIVRVLTSFCHFCFYPKDLMAKHGRKTH